ncbi:MAG: hypothetical protein KIS66_09215 [Fimbriimonadaceae bacterium]|nr:hypothetical protein [Fimbriimonadaceae bacterium]
MKRPSKKDIKAAVEKLKDKPAGGHAPEIHEMGKPSGNKSHSKTHKNKV